MNIFGEIAGGFDAMRYDFVVLTTKRFVGMRIAVSALVCLGLIMHKPC
jgi:hypothetical protein